MTRSSALSGEGAELIHLDESYVNALLVLVVVTCVAGPILVERYATRRKAELPSVTR